MRYQVSAAARLDLLQIWNYLAEHATFRVADRILADLEKAIERVAESPNLGHPREDLTDVPLLFYRVHSYLVAYDTKTRPMTVARVVHGARDLRTLFERA